MPLQGPSLKPLARPNLSMLTLGIEGDVRPNELQPDIEDGMHLRWSFQPTQGFPWYGYYLYRRPSGDYGEPVCISGALRRKKPGFSGAKSLSVGFGSLTSNVPLVFTEDFHPNHIAEVDLAYRDYVRFETQATETIHRAIATIGFRDSGGGLGKSTCVEFTEEHPARVRNPLRREQASFTAYDYDGARLHPGEILEIDGHVGWSTGYRAEIALPCDAGRVTLELAHGSQAPTAYAFDQSGNGIDRAVMSTRGPETLTLQGRGITAVHIEASQGETVLLRICWECAGDLLDEEQGDRSVCIPIKAEWCGVVVDSVTVCGQPGHQKTIELRADAIDRVEFGSGKAALIELCVVTNQSAVLGGWDPIEGFEYPLCLPVAHADYPCPGAPTGFDEARDRGLARITYGSTRPWEEQPFHELYERLERLVAGGPPDAGGEAMFDRFEPVVGTPAPPPEVGGKITHQRQRPLELLLLATLHPAVAQMLGLYWLDRTVEEGKAYDYLLVADHTRELGGTAESGLDWIENVHDFSVIDGYIAYDRIVEPATPLPAPKRVRAYALPGATVAQDSGGPCIDATNNAGLRWNRRVLKKGILQQGGPILYHVWRADLGDVETPSDPAEGDFVPVTLGRPVPVSDSITKSLKKPVMPIQWPKFRLHYIDRGLCDGWYTYRLSGVDIFGRHTLFSAAARWYQWASHPEPVPWYYKSSADHRQINPSRIRLLDKIPPPPPPGVEAFALDPDDPDVLRDKAWKDWQSSLSDDEKSSVIGLRVRWHWGVEQQRQAPDTREFRVYYHPAPLNTLRGRVTKISEASDTETDVETDIPNTQPANAFAGMSVRVGTDSFRITSSQSGTPLKLRVRNIGAKDEVRPEARKRCALPLTPGHAMHLDYADPHNWQDRLLVVPYGKPVRVESGIRYYEAFLPIPQSADRAGLPLGTTVDDPIAMAVIGVTAADDKQHTLDERGEADRYGNESEIIGPATVLRVRRVKPDPPAALPDSPCLWASAADYNARSYFTYRWLPSASLRTLVYRALDDAIFKADAALRPRTALSESDAEFFPDPADEPSWNQQRRQQVADELNGLNSVNLSDDETLRTTYEGLSNDALRVLAGLPSIDRVFVQLNHQAIDPDEPETGAPDGLRWRSVGPDLDSGSLATGERAYVDTLDGRASNRFFYRCAYVDEVQNVGDMGLATPPVCLPDVTAPAAPRIARLTAGDRRITIEWASNLEPDLTEYRIYRTQDPDAKRDIRLMDLVHTVAVAAGSPADRPGIVSWTDDPVAGLCDTWYRIVAVDRVHDDPKGGGGNVSHPSPAMRGRAYDQTPPVPPEITTLEWLRVDASGTVHTWSDPVPAGETWERAVRIAWGNAGDGVRLLVEVMGASDEGFAACSEWLDPGTTEYLHYTTRSFEAHTYRLMVVSSAGNRNAVFKPSPLSSPA